MKVLEKKRKIGEKEFIVKELTVDKWLEAYRMVKDVEGISDIINHLDEILPLTSNVTSYDLQTMPPHQIQHLFNDFKEVNKVFFSIKSNLGIDEILQKMKVILIETFLSQSLNSISKVLK